MSVEIHQFLDNSGGSNFTERAPRPPVPGEENELHSTGGHSNKSSGSYKSLTSNRSNSSGNGGATPRRSQKVAKLPPTTLTDTQPTAALTADQDNGEAPLGFEPEGSANEEFTESNPAYTRWTEGIDHLLEDADGVALFQKYLTQESSVNLFEFYFAWKYLQQLDGSNPKDMGSLVKTMYKAFIKGDKADKKLTVVCKDTRECITKLVSTKQYTKSIFDSAKDQVVEVLKQEFYLPFLKSTMYMQYIQSMEDSPKESTHSSGATSTRPLSSALPTVPEHSELEFCRVATSTSNHSEAPLLSLTAKNMEITQRLRMETKVKPEEQAG